MPGRSIQSPGCGCAPARSASSREPASRSDSKSRPSAYPADRGWQEGSTFRSRKDRKSIGTPLSSRRSECSAERESQLHRSRKPCSRHPVESAVASRFPLSFNPFYESRETLVQLYSFVTVVGRHIRENHLISRLESVLDFDGVHRTLPQHHLHFVRVLPVRLQFEELNRAVQLPEDRPSHEYHVVQALELDRSIHAQIRVQHARRRCVLAHDQRHIHGHRTVEDRGIDARNPALYVTITRVDVRVLTNYDIFYLCFGDLQLGFQLGGLRHLAQRRAGGHLLADFHGRGKLLQYAIETGPYVQLIHLAFLQVELPTQLCHLDLGGGQLGLFGGRVDGNSLLFQLQAAAQLHGPDGGDFGVHLAEQALFGQRRVAVSLEFGGVEVGIHLGHGGLHIQVQLFQRDLQVGIVGFGGLLGVLGVQKVGFQFLAGQNHDHRIGPHRGAGIDEDALHPAFGGGWYEHRIDRHERSQPANFAGHGAALHRVPPHHRQIHRGRRRLQPAHHHAHTGDRRYQDNTDRNPADQPLLAGVFALYIHLGSHALRARRLPIAD